MKTVLIAECGTVTRIHLMSGFLSVVTTGWHGASLKFKWHCVEISVEMQYEHGLSSKSGLLGFFFQFSKVHDSFKDKMIG